MGTRDPFFSAIVCELGRQSLDASMFESLSADLVAKKGIPTNVVPGGADRGYDFEIVVGDGEPGPGVATTGQRVLDNLRRNLNRNRAACPHAARTTYVVTSRPLTPQRRQHLFDCARQAGYTLLGTSDQADVADYIYSNPHWALDLLQLTGRPSALSPIPRSSRPLVKLPLVGRADVLERMRRADGDVLLVGNPGSGKTALLAHLAEADEGAFLVDTDQAHIATAVRELSPRRVFIDDVADSTATVRDVLGLRREIGANFALVVTAWRHDPPLEQALCPDSSNTFVLERLTRDEMVEVVCEAGISGPVPLVREILNQAEGIPGLAVALVQSAIAGSMVDLFHGDVLGLLMSSTVQRLLATPVEGQEAIRVLAVLALASDGGLTVADVASGLHLPPTRIQALIRMLEPGGVVIPVGDRIAVRPRPLRRYLIREAFFSTAPIDYQPWLRLAPSLGSCVRELAWASMAGAAIPLLLAHVVESADTVAARIYAGCGRAQACDLLQVAPQLAVPIAREALHTAPDVVLPLLLEAAVGDDRALHSTPEHPLRIVKDWMLSGVPGTGEALRRRRETVRAASAWVSSGGSRSVAIRLCCEAVVPVFEAHEIDPGAGMKLTWSHGTLTSSEIPHLATLWESTMAILTHTQLPPWVHLLSTCHQVAFPALGPGPQPDVAAVSRSLACRMIEDIGSLGAGHPGVLDRLNTLLNSLGKTARFSISDDYVALFGAIDLGDWKRDQQRRSQAIDRLVDSWMHEPSESAERLGYLQSEAALVESHGDGSAVLCRRLAEKVTEPEVWLAALTHAGADSLCIEPFLDKVVANRGQAWEETVLPLIGTAADDAVTSVILRSSAVTDALWSRVSSRLDRRGGSIELLATRNQIPLNNLRRLLRHDSRGVKAAVAEGMWQGEHHGTVSATLQDDWRAAVVDSLSDSYWLREMLLTSPELAEHWLRQRIQLDDWRALSQKANVDAAVSVIPDDRRLALLKDIPEQFYSAELVQAVVGESPKIFAALVQDEALSDLADAPLRRTADDTWRSFASIAVASGIEPRSVAACSVFRWGCHSGPESAHLQSLADEFQPWLHDNDAAVASTARIAIEILDAKRSEALKGERRRAVEGRD